jgi:hypothetical protein
MPENHRPQSVHLPLLIGEAFGRILVPLAGLPDGVAGFTVPRKGEDGQNRVPLDRKSRVWPKEADLLGTQPVEAFLPPPELSPAQLGWILETGTSRRWQTMEGKFGERAWPVAIALLRAGGVVIRCDIKDAKTFTPRSLRLTHAWAAQADDLLREIRGLPVPSVARTELLNLMGGIPELDHEAKLLAAALDHASLRVPTGSRTGAGAWTVYDAAIRAACYWHQHQVPGGRRLTEKEIAGKALGGSKKWTPAGKAAFANVLDSALDVVLDKADYEIRVRGPLRWTVGSVAADATKGHPWIGLPSGGIHIVGRIERAAHGVLVVENSDTFQQVCLLSDVTDQWLCVWGKGSVSDGVVAFLKTMSDLPIAAWCDLDAYGIEIVSNLGKRLERQITPVGMNVDLYINGTQHQPDDLPDSLRVAQKMAINGPESLRSLAGEIVAAGGLGCEQETLYDEVLSTLFANLIALER